ncbi:MAG: lipoyl synthase [Candidatus Sumerlaeota bacterium]|nr:lipoyl synthase [Candidatus Sumerlaeota bacterium]
MPVIHHPPPQPIPVEQWTTGYHPGSLTPAQLAETGRRLPPWIRGKIGGGGNFNHIRSLVDDKGLHTVCEEARCPNLGECWSRGTATFMILGDTCTRTCRFCAVKTGRPQELDLDEPRRVADSVANMGLRHAVITSVNRDELRDGGAAIFAETIERIRSKSPGCRIEVLIPDFLGDAHALDMVFAARPEILNHNLETVPHLYATVRPQAVYARSLQVLERAKAAGLKTKTGIMLGVGETLDEVRELMADLVAIECDIFTIGQYLQPTPAHLPITRFAHPEEFAQLKREGEAMGIPHVESGPMVRSSYHADEQSDGVLSAK